MYRDPVDPKHHHYVSRIRSSNQNENLNQEQKNQKSQVKNRKFKKNSMSGSKKRRRDPSLQMVATVHRGVRT